MCASSSNAFAWVGAILVNIGFITLITWGAATLWPLGFVLSAAYTAVLSSAATWFERQDGYSQVSDTPETPPAHTGNIEEEREVNAGAEAAPEDASVVGKVPVLVSLLHGLSVLSLGVTGFFLPVNIFPLCNEDGNWHPAWKWTWTTNISSLPPGVQQWALNPDTTFDGASFGYVASTQTTLFEGSEASETFRSCLWSTLPSQPPRGHSSLLYPHQFTKVSDKAVCFVSLSRVRHQDHEDVYCSDGGNIRIAKDPGNSARSHSPAMDLVTDEGLLWFKEYPVIPNEHGRLIFSLEPSTMVMLLHSQRTAHHDSDDSSNCPHGQTARTREEAMTAFFTTAIPIALVSIVLWKKKQVPSMAVTTYVGLTLIFVSVLIFVTAETEPTDTPFKWWFSITGFLYLTVLSYLVLSKSDHQPHHQPHQHPDKAPLRWGLVVGGIAFFHGMMMSLIVYDDDELWRWVLLNLLVFLPLIFFGAATETVFLMFLGAFGFLIDTGRFAACVGEHIDGGASVPIQFLVFSLTGLGIGALGFQLSKYQHHVNEWALTLVRNLDRRMNSWMEEEHNQDDTTTDALLPPTEEEA